jgi:phosphohistidine phosphatase
VKRVYLVRHGKAADSGYARDEDRPLTEEGRERMRRNAAALADAAGALPEVWLCSPFVRAVQTCEITVAAFGSEGPVEITRALVPSAGVGELSELIDRRPEKSLVLVGHEPMLSETAAHLLGRASLGVPFKKGAVIAVDLHRAGAAGRLAFHLRPAGDDREPEIRDHL